jgi:RimJ/RimL family protein N-acetyltransferase
MSKLDVSGSIVLENTRARLEPLSLAHVDLLLPVAQQDPELLRYSPSTVYTRELLTEYIRQALSERAAGTKYPFAIFDKYTGQYAGSTSFGAISNADQRLEIGWTWIGKDFQRTGLNRNCKLLQLSYVFETLGFERVEFKTDARNMQSRKALEQIGALQEGIFRNHYHV